MDQGEGGEGVRGVRGGGGGLTGLFKLSENLSPAHLYDEWGRNSSLVVFGLAVHSVEGSILLWGIFFSGRGDFFLGVNMGSNSIPPKLFRMIV